MGLPPLAASASGDDDPLEKEAGLCGPRAFTTEVYNLPPDPVVPTMKGREAWTSMGWGALGMAVVALGAVLLGREVTRE